MKPVTHLISGFFLGLILFLIFPEVGILEATLVFFSSFLIDGDYLLYYFYKSKNLSLIKTYRYAKEKGQSYKKLSRKDRKKYFRAFRAFHGIEALVVLFLLGHFLHQGFYYILIGSALHLAMDWSYEIKHNLRQDKISIILSMIRFRKLKEI